MFSSPLLSVGILATLVPSLLASPLVPRQVNQRQYFVKNHCPTAVNLYIGGVLHDTIPTRGSVTKNLGINEGFFYTNVNAGATSAEGTARVAFLSDFYYIVRDPIYINAGISVAPRNQSAFDGFCPKIQCDSIDCVPAFPQPPTRFPAITDVAPNSPYFRCPVPNIAFDITFCPTGAFPDQTTTIHPSYTSGKCIDVRGGVFANGTPVQLYDCNGSAAQKWLIKRGTTKVQLAGTNFCLDAGSNPANGVGLKIWQCYDNLPAQKWNYSDDNRITLSGQALCADLTDGNFANSNQLQTWQCTANNLNQVWTI